MSEARKSRLRVDLDRSVKLEFHGSAISSNGGLLAYRELDEAVALTVMADDVLTDSSHRKQHSTQSNLAAASVDLSATGGPGRLR